MVKYMEWTMICVFLFLVTGVDRIRSDDGLKCYNCDTGVSTQHDVCGDDFKLTSSNTSFIIKNCEYCSKYYFIRTGAIVRNCTLKKKNSFKFKFGCDNEEVNGETVKTCFCEDNLCNGAILWLTGLPVHLLVCLFVYIFHDGF